MKYRHLRLPPNLVLVQEFARRLAEQVDPQVFRATLFGSCARGEVDEKADLDLFVARFAASPLKQSRG